MSDESVFVPVAPAWFAANTGGIAVLGVLALRTRRRGLSRLFWAAVAVHAVEAGYSYRAARAAGFGADAPRWAAQTLAVGFPSLLALRDARRAAVPLDGQ